MYFPAEFDRQRATELGRLVIQAYQRLEAFKKNQPWTIQDGYELVCEVTYRTFLSFDAGEESQPETAIDREIENFRREAGPVSFGAESLFSQDVPVGFLASKNGNAYLVFRGTATPREWIFDANIRMQEYRLPNWGKVSDGFQNIYRRSRESFIKTLAGLDKSMPLFISGHSLGGALSLLALPDVADSTPFKQPVLYNFGCPRVGDADFNRAYQNLPCQEIFRVVNTSDLVTSVPLPVEIPLLPSGFYCHVGTPVDFNVQANDLNLNHSMDTYLAALNA